MSVAGPVGKFEAKLNQLERERERVDICSSTFMLYGTTNLCVMVTTGQAFSVTLCSTSRPHRRHTRIQDGSSPYRRRKVYLRSAKRHRKG